MLGRDVGYGFRTLAKRRTLTFAAVITLGVGIGATSAIVGTLNAIVLRPLPYPAARRLVSLFLTTPRLAGMQINLSREEAKYVDKHARSFEALVYYDIWPADWVGDGEPEQLTAVKVSSGFFDMLGAQPTLGRFLGGDEKGGMDSVVIISNALWVRRFASDRSVLGKPMIMSGRPFNIIGVAEPGFRFPNDSADAWVPFPMERGIPPERLIHCSVLARLRPHVKMSEVQAELNTLANSLPEAFPEFDKDWSFRLVELQDQTVGDVRSALFLLLGGATLLLMIACVNVANLSLAGNWNRRKEISIRAALGASPRHIVRQVVLENLILAALGGSLGIVLAISILKVLRSFAPPWTPRIDQVHPDWILLAATAVCSVVVGFLCALAPAIQSLKVDLSNAMKSGDSPARRTGHSFGTGFLNYLVAAEVALALLLLITSTLMIKSFAQLTRVQPGIRTDHVLMLSMTLPESKYPNKVSQVSFIRNVLDRVNAVPGVESAAATGVPLLQGSVGVISGVRVQGREDAKDSFDSIELMNVSPHFFQTLAVPLLHGRIFDERDSMEVPPVAVVNESMARLGWGTSNPVGSRITLGPDDKGDVSWAEVVGVVADTRDVEVVKPAQPEIYVPLYHFAGGQVNLSVHTKIAPFLISKDIQRAIWMVDREEPITNIAALDSVLSQDKVSPRFRTILFGAFAGIGLLLAVVGVYGVVSYSVGRRTREIGVRIAIGGSPRQVTGLLLRHGMRPVAIGIALGLLAALIAEKVLSSLLFEVNPRDPAAFVFAGLMLAGVAALACFIPAYRAAHVDPIKVLRHE